MAPSTYQDEAKVAAELASIKTAPIEPMPIAKAATHKAVSEIEGAGRGRAARAAIVKKVMAEKGLSMIQASKYVKERGLY